jgi:hypothetical protein
MDMEQEDNYSSVITDFQKNMVAQFELDFALKCRVLIPPGSWS